LVRWRKIDQMRSGELREAGGEYKVYKNTLVRFAVRTAGRRGGTRMTAHVQLPNVAFFEHLGWYTVGGPVSYVGRPHQTMAIDLPLVLRRL